MKKNAYRTATLLFAASLCTGCMVDADEAPEVEAPSAEPEGWASSGMVANVTGLSWRSGQFAVDIEVPAAMRSYRGYLVAELQYTTLGDAVVSPFAATRISQVRFTRVSPTTYAATLYVTGREPRDINAVQSWVSANPTPHP